MRSKLKSSRTAPLSSLTPSTVPASAVSPLRLTSGVLTLTAAIAVLAFTLRPSPLLSLFRHWQVFGLHVCIAAALTAFAAYLVGRRFRAAVLALLVVLTAVAALVHPVCEPISASERPAFESVLSLSERAAQGESFCHLDGQWYLCKSFVSRAFFF